VPRKPAVQVFGPAYLDRVLVVDRPLAAAGEPPLDGSVDGRRSPGSGLSFRDPGGVTLAVEPPPGWPGPRGRVELSAGLGGASRSARGLAWHDDLGGMGAGYASALGGTLVSALGAGDDPVGRAIAIRLAEAGVEHRPIRVEGHESDWTLLLTSGPHGDKLPVGFRGCHSALSTLGDAAAHAGACDLRVVASLPNRLAAEALRAGGAAVRMFAPARRNVADRDDPVIGFADRIDILCCNRGEWKAMADREAVADRVSLLAVTDGPAGSVVRFREAAGGRLSGEINVPAFPRSRPPKDTNRAGEAYAATLVRALLDAGWVPGPTDAGLVAGAAGRAAAAAALVLDRPGFGFPTADEVDAALRAGRVGGPSVEGGGGGG